MIVYVDEVGYSSIAGPVLTCAVAVDEKQEKIEGVKDSKKLTRKNREELFNIISSKIIHKFGSASPKKIEKLNIYYARYYAMKIAVEKLIKDGIKIDKVIVDGKFIIPNLLLPQEPVIKADDKYWQCGAASILAKVKRDNLMLELSKINKYSYYKFDTNAGYYTEAHRKGVILHGPTILHRYNFYYTKYCIFCHEIYKKFLQDGKSYEEYLEFENNEIKKNKNSFFNLWKGV